MSDPVQLSVRSGLAQIIDEMEKIKEKAKEVQKTFEDQGKGVEEGLEDNTKRVDKFFSSLRGLSRRVADQLRGDFKSLVSINALGDSMKLSGQFRDSISETVSLSDKIRKLGTTFGIAKDQFSSFQAFLTKGLGEIGMSSEVASRALDGLSTTPVRGQQNILAYSTTAGMLASISGQAGQEGEIAKGMANTIQARGGNVNDQAQLNALSEAIRKTYVATGAKPTETLKSMNDLFRAMPEDMRKKISPAGLAQLSAVGSVGGPNATKFFEEYASMGPIQRMAIDAQGGGNLFSDQGLDLEKLKKFIDGIASRIGGDPRQSLQTLGIGPEAAEGLVRLREKMSDVTEAQDRMAKATGSLSEAYRESMGFTEAFRANLNRVKKMLAEPLAAITNTGTDILSKASESDAGAAGVALGGGLLATVLAGGALKGIGKGLKGVGSTVAKGAAAEALTGEKTIPVYVTNAAEIGGGGIGGVAATGGPGMLGKAGMVGMAALAGIGIGQIIEPFLSKQLDKTDEMEYGGVKLNLGDRIGYAIAKLMGDESVKELDERQNRQAMPAGVRAVSPDAPAKPFDSKASDTSPERRMDETKKILVPGQTIQQSKETIREKSVKETVNNTATAPTSPFGNQPQRIIIETTEPGLKARTKGPSRGATN